MAGLCNANTVCMAGAQLGFWWLGCGWVDRCLAFIVNPGHKLQYSQPSLCLYLSLFPAPPHSPLDYIDSLT